jgi:hypothetical protein
MSDAQQSDSARWLDEPGNVRKIYHAVWIACALLLLGGEALLRWSRAQPEVLRHGFSFESWPGFYALFGFVACVSLVLAAKQLRKWVMRPEDYYEPEDSASQDEGADGN